MCVDGAWGRCSADQPLPPLLEVTVRDFRESHPDFEINGFGNDRGIVAEMLGPDDKPIYQGPTPTTSNRGNFDQWYRDVTGINLRTSLELPLRPSSVGTFVFSDEEFFPIDDELFGNEGRQHNFHFTLEATATFVYNGREVFRFTGDDDVFVFLNRRLVIDLGGVHSRQDAAVSLDELAPELSLEVGERYPIHLFFAERHTTGSSFTVETSLADSLRCE